MSTDHNRALEDLGICIGCCRPILVGEVVTPWDDEIGHANCDDPASLDVAHLEADPDCPEPVILLGNPATYVSLASIRRAKAADATAHAEWQQFLAKLRQEQEIREAGRWSSQ